MTHSEIFKDAAFVRSKKDFTAPCFRADFTVKSTENAKIVICGLGNFRLFINGVRVSGDELVPVTSFYHDYDELVNKNRYAEVMSPRCYALSYDISDFLIAGLNKLAVICTPGWYYKYAKKPVLCYKITTSRDEIFSGKSIKCCDSPLCDFSFTKGQIQDFTKASFIPDWTAAELSDSRFSEVEEVSLPRTEFYIQDCPNDKIIRTISPEKILSDSDFDYYDCKENISGTFVFACEEKGEKITVEVSEEKNPDGTLHEKWIHGQKSEFICDGTEREYRLIMNWQAFRYIKISKKARLLRVDVIHTDITPASSFECENDVLNKLYSCYIRTQLCNLHMGIPSDCPHLERRGYTGDGQLCAETAMLTLDTQKLYRKWIYDIADSQDKISGHIQYTAPYIESGGGPGGWGCAIVEVPYAYYKMYGDSEPFCENFDSMLHYFGYLETHSENDLVTSDQPDQWCLGDWCAPQEKHGTRPEIPVPFVNNYFYIKSIDRCLSMLDIIGREEARDQLEILRSRRVEAIIKNYFDAGSGDFAENKNSANAFALSVGLGDERTLANLVSSVRQKGIDTGIFGTDIVPSVLLQNGYFDEAISFLSGKNYPSFGYMFECGATTLWEEWKDPRSMSHPMFGAAVKYLFYDVLGIKQQSAGFKKVLIAPKTNEVTGNVSGSINTKYGKISVSVDRKNKTLCISVPEEIETEVEFDGEVKFY